jgi:dihydrodipicolinate synthase/N-acetylneuraminate lyase
VFTHFLEKIMFKGSFVALITPFDEGEEVDYAALDKLVDFHLANQTDGLIVLGTTGEAPTVSKLEHQNIIKHVITSVKGRIPVIAGVGKNNTSATLELAQSTADLGVTALLIVRKASINIIVYWLRTLMSPRFYITYPVEQALICSQRPSSA